LRRGIGYAFSQASCHGKASRAFDRCSKPGTSQYGFLTLGCPLISLFFPSSPILFRKSDGRGRSEVPTHNLALALAYICVAGLPVTFSCGRCRLPEKGQQTSRSRRLLPKSEFEGFERFLDPRKHGLSGLVMPPVKLSSKMVDALLRARAHRDLCEDGFNLIGRDGCAKWRLEKSQGCTFTGWMGGLYG